MSIEKFQPSYDIYQERMERLKIVVPEAFADGKINWDVLRECLGSFVEDDANKEHYAFTWPGKRDARRLAGKPPQGTLIPAPGEGVNEDTTENIFIEGDNLEVLKLLQKSYASRIKMIYIDPPYNIGDDRIYKDNFEHPLDEYLKLTGQIDESGTPLVSNLKSDGRFHSKWLNMMYPRFMIARNLLQEDGVIFVSIGDDEVQHLKTMLNEVFGEENFEGHIHWRRRHNQPNDPTKMIGLVAEHILAYSRDKEVFKKSGVGKIGLTGNFSNPDNDPRGDWASKPWKTGSGQSGTIYIITTPTGAEYEEEWMGDENTYKALLEDKRIIFPHGGKGQPRKKYFKSEREIEGQCATNWWSHDVFGHNQEGSDELFNLFGKKNVFSNPKPSRLILHLIMIANCKNNDLILDFFAGSSTTSSATYLFNLENNYSCKYIMVQLPEVLNENEKEYRDGYEFCREVGLKPNIAEIGKERIRRVIKRIVEEEEITEELKDQDFGFKVFKLHWSHFNQWQEYKGTDVTELMDLFAKQEDALIPSWKAGNLLVEIMLQEGFPLHSKIEIVKAITANKVFQVKSEFCNHMIFVCLDPAVDTTTIEGLPLSDKDIFICLDSALTDEQKVALSDKGVIKTI